MSTLSWTGVALLSIQLFAVAGCSKHTPVPVTQCNAVVTHASRVLGDDAGSSSQLMKDCREATDQQRGCALAAKSAISLMRCTM